MGRLFQGTIIYHTYLAGLWAEVPLTAALSSRARAPGGLGLLHGVAEPDRSRPHAGTHVSPAPPFPDRRRGRCPSCTCAFGLVLLLFSDPLLTLSTASPLPGLHLGPSYSLHTPDTQGARCRLQLQTLALLRHPRAGRQY